ncbi:MAG: 2-polyprenyl-3-methyl-5-hydroxy-6-metoxy-1,4-benzoquinol methylase [Parcubacteria group bacterium Gr01-1014_3]|nr:MAG: 2-polyprenyl-3-methyl-5-hydroxy-6-metoxy-1,4-benzoquinol methylase [Parcubacteria group bacterium Gr01-1014_3]
MEYLNPDEIKNNKNRLFELQQRASWDIRSGRILNLTKEFISNKSSVIVDAASADGSLLAQLSEAGYKNLTGADIDDYRHEAAQKFPFKKIDFCFDKFPWADNSVDAVISSQTIEHLENPFHFGREASRILKPGGIFIISTPNPFHILNRLLFLRHGDIYHFLEGDNHITFFTRSIFKKTFLKYFRLLAVRYGKSELKHWLFNWLQPLKHILPSNQWFGRYIYYVLQKPQ